jgi:transposase-like protein
MFPGASVLKAAVEGRLAPTEAALARAEKRDFEPADVVLARILKERQRRWEEAELARMKATGKTPKDDKWKVKYEPPASVDITRLPQLPAGWCWGNVDQLGTVSGGLTQNAKRDEAYERKLPFLRVANVYANALVLDEIKTIGVEPGEVERTLVLPGDLLVVEGNGSIDQIGRVALWMALSNQSSTKTTSSKFVSSLGRSLRLIRFVDTFRKADTMCTPMAETPKRRRARRRFDDDFKAQAVRLVLDEGKTVGTVARDLDLTETALREWVRRSSANRTRGRTGLATAEREELLQLRKDNRQLRLEREILKNAAAFFATEPATRSR